MFEFAIGMGVGLVLGWNFIPQPTWMANLYSNWFNEGR